MFGSVIKGEMSVCCNVQVKRGAKLAGYEPYCMKCRKKCEIQKEESKEGK